MSTFRWRERDPFTGGAVGAEPNQRGAGAADEETGGCGGAPLHVQHGFGYGLLQRPAGAAEEVQMPTRACFAAGHQLPGREDPMHELQAPEEDQRAVNGHDRYRAACCFQHLRQVVRAPQYGGVASSSEAPGSPRRRGL
jgi:hypothetical protein